VVKVVSTMPEYRIYTLESGNRLVAPPDVIECDSDQEAIIEARILLDDLDVEVRQGSRVVVRLRPADK
jgi:hypothetical protein